jgi:pantoate--beta-alanine ligase
MAQETPISGNSIEIIRATEAMHQRVATWRRDGLGVGLVPTMGALHDGHLALVRAARAGADRVIVSLFVNPKQFGPAEDLAAYPRDEAEDARLIAQAGGDALFAPGLDEMYPDGFATTVRVASVSQGLCGDHRPGHFEGVATVVTKLLNQCQPDAAWFGEKDYQQLQVIRRLVADLALPVAIHGVPTVREPDGLAMSSRNAYLDPAERRAAPALFRTLTAIAATLSDGRADAVGEATRGVAAMAAAGFASVDYLEVRDAETLAPVDAVTRPARVLAAARLGRTRLIDNVPAVPR